MDFGSEEILEKVSQQMAELHLSIDDANTKFLAAERRHNYTAANIEAEKTNKLAADAAEVKAKADAELEEAMPA